MFLFGLRQVIGQVGGVILVDFGRDFVEPGDEGVLDPVNQKFGAQNQKAVGSKWPETFWKQFLKQNKNYVQQKFV